MASVRPPARPLKSSVTERVVEALSLCLPTRSSFTPTTEKCRQQQQQRFDGFQLTLSCKRSAEMMALNRRVAHSLDLEQIFAWQTELEELYARRKQVLQLPPSTVSSSDSAVFLQCNEQSGDGDFELFLPSPSSIQDDRSNPDSGYLAMPTDVDSLTSADLSVAGSKRSVGSDGSSRLTSLRNCRWLTTAETDRVSAVDEAPSSGSTLTNASSSNPSSTTTADDDGASVLSITALHAAAAVTNIAAEPGDVESVYDELKNTDDGTLQDGTFHRQDEHLATSSTLPRSIPPPPPLPTSTSTRSSTLSSCFDDEDLSEFPPPPPLTIPALASISPSLAATNKLPPLPLLIKLTSTRASTGSECEEFPEFLPPPPQSMTAAVDSSSPSSSIRSVSSTLRKLPPPPPPLKRISGGEVDEISVFPPPPAMMVGHNGFSSDIPAVATLKRSSLPPTPPKPSKTPTPSDVGTFAFRTLTSSSSLARRHSATRPSLPPTPPAPPPPPLALLPTTIPSTPSPSTNFPLAFPTSSDSGRASVSGIPAPPPRMWSQEEGSVDWETTSTTESVYSTIAETLPGTVIDTDTAAAVGGLAAALKGVKLRAVTDTDKWSSSDSAGRKDPMSALVDQLHCGVQLRPTALGNIIRGRDSQQDSSSEATVKFSPTQEADDEEYANLGELPPARAPAHAAKPLPPIPLKKSVPYSNSATLNSPANHIDVTQLAGHQFIPPDCPQWKRALIEKKNAALLSEATKEHQARKQEDRWKDIPEWKRNLIAKKQEQFLREKESRYTTDNDCDKSLVIIHPVWTMMHFSITPMNSSQSAA